MRVVLIFSMFVLGLNSSYCQTYGNFFFGYKYVNYKGLNAKFDFAKGGKQKIRFILQNQKILMIQLNWLRIYQNLGITYL